MALLLDLAVNPLASEGLHYGIVFDAGSSGTRIHVYSWRSNPVSGGFELVEDDLVKIKPGLSAYAQDAKAAGLSLEPLLAHAERKVPADRRATTPVFLLATSGLRLIGQETASAILKSVGDFLASSAFAFRDDWASIMSGTDEGLFGWVAVNYLLGSLSGIHSSTTSGVIDLGGGSVQLVYALPPTTACPPEYSSNVSFAGRMHRLYVTSHLGFGLDEARMRAAQKLMQGPRVEEGVPVSHPCLPVGHQAVLVIGNKLQNAFVGSGKYEQCADLYRSLFDKGTCAIPPCSFGGTFQPPLPNSIFGFSYLYDRTRAIGLLDSDAQPFGAQNMSVEDIRKASAELCAMLPAEVEARFAGCEDAAKWANFCGDTTYITVLLEHGFGIGDATPLTMGNKVSGVELVWTLGAMISKANVLALTDPAPMPQDEL